MGRIYKALHRVLNKIDALKTLQSANLKNPLWLGGYERDQQKLGQDKATVHE
jgi:hypothetical protein